MTMKDILRYWVLKDGGKGRSFKSMLDEPVFTIYNAICSIEQYRSQSMYYYREQLRQIKTKPISGYL